MNHAGAMARILTTRTEVEIAKLADQIVQEEGQLRRQVQRLESATVDCRALEQLIADKPPAGEVSVALAHELSDVCLLEQRLRGRCEKMERDLIDLRGRLARWELMRKRLA